MLKMSFTVNNKQSDLYFKGSCVCFSTRSGRSCWCSIFCLSQFSLSFSLRIRIHIMITLHCDTFQASCTIHSTFAVKDSCTCYRSISRIHSLFQSEQNDHAALRHAYENRCNIYTVGHIYSSRYLIVISLTMYSSVTSHSRLYMFQYQCRAFQIVVVDTIESRNRQSLHQKQDYIVSEEWYKWVNCTRIWDRTSADWSFLTGYDESCDKVAL